MERRRSKRKKVNIDAEMISGDNAYQGVIDNFSGVGIHAETDSVDPMSSSSRFTPGDIFEVKFNTSPGQTMQLRCRIVWSYKSAPQGLITKIGMEIIDPSDEYLQFYNAL